MILEKVLDALPDIVDVFLFTEEDDNEPASVYDGRNSIDPRYKYTGKDVDIIIEDNGYECYYIRFKDDAEYDIPYSAISNEDFAFLHLNDDDVIAGSQSYQDKVCKSKAYKDKTCEIFAKYINSGDGVKRAEKPPYDSHLHSDSDTHSCTTKPCYRYLYINYEGW